MARPQDVCFNGAYKIWKPWYQGDYYNTCVSPQISPIAGSEIKLNDLMIVTIVDDIGIYGGGSVTMYYYLYDFIKTGRKKIKKKTIVRKKEGYVSNAFYDESLDEKLGGEKQILGGGI